MCRRHDPWRTRSRAAPVASCAKRQAEGCVRACRATSSAAHGFPIRRALFSASRSGGDPLGRPHWRTTALAALLFAFSLLLASAEATSPTLGRVLAWPMRLAERLFGPVGELGTLGGTLRFTVYHAINLLCLYFVAALILRQRPGKDSDNRASRIDVCIG